MSRLQQGISKLNSLSNHGGSSISRLSSPSMGGSSGGGKNYDELKRQIHSKLVEETVFAGTAHVIHDFLTPVFDDRVADARGEGVERFIPRGAFPFSFAAFTGAFEWIENAIGISNLV
jgi:hypothetical protein